MEEFEVLGTESLAANGFHGAAEAVQDGETSDVSEGKTECSAG